MKTVSVLGSTGSIGTQALDVISKLGMGVCALAAKSNAVMLAEQAETFKPSVVCIFDESKEPYLHEKLAPMGIKVLCGMEGLCEAACMDEADVVLNSVVGMVGLEPTLAAISCGKDIALANKETLVTGGKLVTELAREKSVAIYPVDSEHSAIFQSLRCGKKSELSKIILTASGGPFYGRTKAELKDVTLSDALKHPTWSMGAKITIDSATLMNKGLELIEAMWLFDVDADDIDIVVHRESVVHSAVEFVDGSVIAQLGVPDMRLPIQYALTYPNRVRSDVKRLSLTDYGTLSFKKPDYETFDCLRACVKAANERTTTAAAIVNAANEAAVSLFVDGKIGFLDMGKLVLNSLEHVDTKDVNSLEDVLDADFEARRYVDCAVSTKDNG